MTAQELKNSILQLAVEGKLVPHTNENASELLKNIKIEKAKLIAEGKIKKEKDLPSITEDEKPFDIPENWCWCRLGEISTYANTKEKISAENIIPEMWTLDLEDIEKNTGRIIQKIFVKDRKIAGDKICFEEGDILYSKLRPYLKKNLIAPANGICSSEIVPFKLYGQIYPEYILKVLICPHIDFIINSVTYGVKMPRVGTETMINLPIPLPPLSEQKAIVAKIEELLPYIEKYDAAYTKLEEFNKKFPADMQKSILQKAVQGKLVPQNKADGNAKNLLAQIKAEKAKLIADGKIKKEKSLAEITEDEIPFDIPENWCWCRLGEICSVKGGKRIPAGSSLTDEKTEHKYIRVADMKNGTVVLDTIKYVPDDIYEKIKNYTISKNDVYITVAGTIGDSGLIPDELDNANLTENADKLILYCGVDKKFLHYFISSPEIQGQIADATTKVGQPKLAILRIQNFLFPLPPLAEQKRIVAKIEELLPLCKKLER